MALRNPVACTVHMTVRGASAPVEARALAATERAFVVRLAGALRVNLSRRTGRLMAGLDHDAVKAVGRPFMLSSERERLNALAGGA